jgi:hypothetical protein
MRSSFSCIGRIGNCPFVALLRLAGHNPAFVYLQTGNKISAIEKYKLTELIPLAR